MNSLVEWKDRPVKYLRDKVISQLKYNLGKDHLEIEEFDQMMRVALSTQSKSELFSLVADLPKDDSPETQESDYKPDVYRNRDMLVSVMSEQKRIGNWFSSKQLRVITVMGASEIDFRDVRFKSDLLYISLDCWFGEVRVIVPPGVNVISNVLTIAAAAGNKNRTRLDPNAPTIVIEGKVLFGELSIKEKT